MSVKPSCLTKAALEPLKGFLAMNTSKTAVIFVLSAFLLVFPSLLAAQTAVIPSGDGLTSDTAYQISELGHLVWMSDTVTSSTGKYYRMTKDIDASETAHLNDLECNPVAL
jgi:hypothetical protein